MPNGIQRAALYIRVSTEEQAQHGLSLAEQRATLEEYVKAQGLRVAGVYADEGISARKRYNRRPALLRLLSDVRDGLVDIILFTKLDRWFRNVGDYYEVQRVLDDCGVSWRAVREDYETVTASGRLKVNIMLSVAQDEADRTGERIRAVFESKLARNEPISGKVPLGYKIEDKKMVVDPATAPIAQDIFRAYLGGRSVNALRKYVMDTYGIVYCHTSYKNMLRNTRYIGRAHGVDGFCEPLISPEDFAKVQEILAVRAQRNSGRPRGSIYLFSGLVYCSECGNRLSSHTINGRYVYYRCSKNQKTHQCPNKKHTSEVALENWLLENVVSQFAEYNMLLEKKALDNPVQIDTQKIKRKMDKLKDLYLNDLIDRDSYQAEYTALREELERANPTINPPPRPVNLAEISNMLASYSGLTRAGKRELWSRVVGKITASPNDDFFVSPIWHS